MSRYVDAEWLKEKIDNMWNGRPLSSLGARILVTIDDAPSIDIVHCNECMYRKKYPCDEIEFYECGHLRLHGTKVGVTDDWFCADGKRKE